MLRKRVWSEYKIYCHSLTPTVIRSAKRGSKSKISLECTKNIIARSQAVGVMCHILVLWRFFDDVFLLDIGNITTI